MHARLFLLWLLLAAAGGAAAGPAEEGKDPIKETTPVTITVLYDNRAGRGGLEPAWGFACLIEGLSDTILFDTGGDAPTLVGNMSKLGIAPRIVDAVALSHAHGDHTGGLAGFLDVRGDAEVYALEPFYAGVESAARARGARAVAVREPVEICPGALLSGDLGVPGGISEECLVLQGTAGVAVVTGCAHPGIVSMVERVKALAGRDVLAVVGGFHLLRTGAAAVRTIVSDLRALGVRHVVPCHCTGDGAIERFATSYGDGFTRCAVGTVVPVGDLLAGDDAARAQPD